MRDRLLADDLIADGFDAAILGVAEVFTPAGSVRRVLYDIDACIDILAKDMSIEEAEEHFSFNVMGSYVGVNTPLFVNDNWKGV